MRPTHALEVIGWLVAAYRVFVECYPHWAVANTPQTAAEPLAEVRADHAAGVTAGGSRGLAAYSGVMTDLAAVLRANGMRLTPQRRRVIDALARLGHATPDAVTAEVGADGGAALPASTIYRALEALEELGLVAHTHLDHRAPTFHLAGHADHIHLVCLGCRAVDEVPVALAGEFVPTELARPERVHTAFEHALTSVDAVVFAFEELARPVPDTPMTATERRRSVATVPSPKAWVEIIPSGMPCVLR